MADRATGYLEDFVRRLRRRLVALRILEAGGLGILAGSVLAVMGMLVLWWERQPGAVLAAVLPTAGAMVGVGLSLRHLPGALAAAREADRQLGLADLLATAWQTDRNAPDGFEGAVLAMADGRCARLSAGDVVLNRLGLRAWGGIGLSVALVLLVALISVNPLTSAASAGSSPAGVGDKLISADSTDAALALRMSRSALVQGQPRGEDDNPMANPDDSLARARAAAGGSAANQTGAASPDGAGGGLGTTRVPRTLVDPLRVAGSSSRAPSAGGLPSGGGDGTASAGGNGELSGSSAGRSASSGSAAPWSSPSWSAECRKAAQAADAGQIPDACRDLVRDYFQPEH